MASIDYRWTYLRAYWSCSFYRQPFQWQNGICSCRGGPPTGGSCDTHFRPLCTWSLSRHWPPQHIYSRRDAPACIEHFTQADIAISAAAVADFKPRYVGNQKIKKEDAIQSIELKTRDVLSEMGKLKQKQFLVGFALETEDETSHAIQKLSPRIWLYWILSMTPVRAFLWTLIKWPILIKMKPLLPWAKV